MWVGLSSVQGEAVSMTVAVDTASFLDELSVASVSVIDASSV
jgi:hypothetical protein